MVEFLVASGLTLVVFALVVAGLAPAQSGYVVALETADAQQRMRVALEAISRELTVAAAGPATGAHQGPLTRAFAAVLPYRIGAPGTPDTITNDVISILSVPAGFAQSTTAGVLTGASGSVAVSLDAGCPTMPAPCGFSVGMIVAVFDGAGAFDPFVVRAVSGATLTLEHLGPPTGRVYPPGSGVAEVQIRVLSRRTDAAGVEQLVRENGMGPAVPIADHVIGLAFQYLFDPNPPQHRPMAAAGEPSSTYGPPPPGAGVQTSAYPPGENCLFSYAGVVVPRLSVLPAGAGGLSLLPDAALADGPWCPDANHPFRFDADLLRLRAVRVSVRVQAGSATLRGPVGSLFARGGTSQDAGRRVPDLEASFTIAPPNLGVVVAP